MELEKWLAHAALYLQSEWGLDEYFSEMAAKLYAYLWNYGLNPQITSGRRTKAEQAELTRRFNAGDSTVVYPPSPKSYHLYGKAIDISTNNPELAFRIAAAIGLKTVRGDRVHFQES